MGFGDDVQFKKLRVYHAFKRIRNFACVEVFHGDNKLAVYARIDPNTVQLEQGFTRNVSKIGHWGTGDLEITLKSPADLRRAAPLLERAYETA
jgi:predicted transport protein